MLTQKQLHTILQPYYRFKTRTVPLRLTSVAELRSKKRHPLHKSIIYLPNDLQLLTFSHKVQALQCHRWNVMVDWVSANIALRQQGYYIRPLDFAYNALLLWPVKQEAIHFNNHSWIVTAYGQDIPQFGPYYTRLAIANTYYELFPSAKPLLLAYSPQNKLFKSMFMWDTTTTDIRELHGLYVPRELNEEKLCKLFNKPLLATKKRSPKYWQELAFKLS